MELKQTKWFLRKPSKLTCLLLVVISPFALYFLLVVSIHAHNAKYNKIYDDLYTAANANGLLVRHYKRTPEPLGFNRFYDESSSYKSKHGLTSNHVGYKDDEGNIILPAIYNGGDWHFYEGLNYAYENGRLGYINPDGTWAFQLSDHSIQTSSSQSFFNGRAVVMKELSSHLITPIWREGAIDKEGNIVIELKYLFIKNFIGELDHEYTIAAEKTIFYPIFENMMNGIDVSLGIEYIFPPQRLIFLDKDGNKVTPPEVRRSIKNLHESASH